ncbi:MAG: hypothetical protein AAB730_01400 [Patescibacteria group bacterium]
MNSSTITLPKKIFEDVVRASAYFEEAQSELEDYLLSRNKAFISRMRKLRQEHQRGKFANWKKLKAGYGL